eukprot:gnl/Spiro4/21345_TR10425_c0_g1_i1.p1 gnl/Spiro4/21345_TR10425_c0_g1~~gnl/Spiro4/21345_TR10425_c0_g1_i1.p1  ORF type:complete len:224 (+),score=73.22 gnl/Spiro4/21345_TR10425_c0_g1_i1:51-674(+)
MFARFVALSCLLAVALATNYRKEDAATHSCADVDLPVVVGICPAAIIVAKAGMVAGKCSDVGYSVSAGTMSVTAGPCGTLTFHKYINLPNTWAPSFEALSSITAESVSAYNDTPDYGSYVAQCDGSSSEVTFVSYPHRDCVGTPVNYSKPLNQCNVEFVVLSWDAVCDDAHISYRNYLGRSCGGSSIKTRTYATKICQNCNNAECKD